MELKLTPEEVGQIVLAWAESLNDEVMFLKAKFNHVEFDASGYGRFTGAVLTYEEPKEGGEDE
ncbi:hypothetical protein [Ferrovum sp.]|uniref:hypothetical protein n=1 Tax=Ferrovum sp. TaxID=2609467 RepID=UPI002630E61A|nr:hypothetical protein [Ferrovum sp.]